METGSDYARLQRLHADFGADEAQNGRRLFLLFLLIDDAAGDVVSKRRLLSNGWRKHRGVEEGTTTTSSIGDGVDHDVIHDGAADEEMLRRLSVAGL